MKHLVYTFLILLFTCDVISQTRLKVVNDNTNVGIENVHLVHLNTSTTPYQLDLIAVSNRLGEIDLATINTDLYVSLSLTHVGFVSQSVRIDRNNEPVLIVKLNPRTTELPTFVVGKNDVRIADDEFIFVPEATLQLNEEITIKEFWIQKHEVTVGQYRQFVKESGYITEVEKGLRTVKVLSITKATKSYLNRLDQFEAETFKKAGKTKFQGWERRFELIEKDSINWRHDEFGKLRTSDDYPVIHITYNDALAYAVWYNLKLPTKEQWMALSNSKVEKDWRRSNSTGIIRRTMSAPVDKMGLNGIYGNVSEYLEKLEIDNRMTIVASPLNTFSSDFKGNQNFIFETESAILEDLFKFGFRCVKIQD